MRMMQGVDNFFRCSFAASERALHRALVTISIRRFTGKEECALNGFASSVGISIMPTGVNV